MTICPPARYSELAKASQTLGKSIPPVTTPVRARMTSTKFRSVMKMKLPRWSSGSTSIANAPPATARMTAKPMNICALVRENVDQTQKPKTTASRMKTARQRMSVSAVPVLAENAMVASQK